MLQGLGLIAGSCFFSPAMAGSQAPSKRRRLDINELPARPTMPSANLFFAMNSHALAMHTMFASGNADYSSLSRSSSLIRTFAAQLEQMQVDEPVAELAKGRVGQPPATVPNEVLEGVSSYFSMSGIAVSPDDVAAAFKQTQESHDKAHVLIGRIGASGLYHAFADMLEAGASKAFEAQASSSPWQSHGVVFSRGNGERRPGLRLVRAEIPCGAPPPPPPPPPWYCPSTAIIEVIGSGLTFLGGTLAPLISSLTATAFCSTVALASLTGDAASEGAGLVASPFELWLCENSQTIVEGMQGAVNAIPGGAATGAGVGAAIGAYLYGTLKDFLKGKGCTV